MSANIQLVNSMFKLSSISASTEFQPLKEPKTEIPSVELVAEFVKVELQEFRLYVMVGVKDAPLGVADGDMYPRQNFPTFFLSSMTTALWEATAPSFSRDAYVLEPSVVAFAFRLSPVLSWEFRWKPSNHLLPPSLCVPRF